ncbi:MULTISPECIES: acyl-CoA dehydrogenase family protein [Streptomyces]|uniref:Acyl-CoA dehydrogenase family protein n=1 Tax=Streptomyces flaveolus TaxID=67297 RepID=A0ABV3ANG5_9ACTN|nr:MULTISPECIES: acyl-CoA dehydrogenase family protein [Streptomyces]KMS67452.1 indole oxygenase [Streptomyces regensis]KOG75176.1 indole oxygenase [Streptomyces antibioticus]
MTASISGERATLADPTRRLVEASREIAPVLRRTADAAERDSRLTPEAERALREAGLFRLGVPKRWGGEELAPADSLEVSAEVALACPSSAWVVMVAYVAQQIAASFGEQARQDLWGDGPDVPMCGVFGSVGVTAVPVEGGLLVSGSWAWASGSHQADWALLGVPLPGEPGAATDRGLALVPASALTIDKTWDMAGMRGTGSDTLIADKVFVPYHRLRRFADVVQGQGLPEEPLYRIPPGSMTVVSMGPLLGMARAVLQLTMEAVEGGKPMAMSLHARLADSPSVQAALAEAATLIDSAYLHLRRSAEFIGTAAASGTTPTLLERARVRMDAGHASTCLRQAVQALLTVSGAGSFSLTKTIQRHWRDLETASRHPTLNPGLAKEMYGRALVGDDRPVSPMV